MWHLGGAGFINDVQKLEPWLDSILKGAFFFFLNLWSSVLEVDSPCLMVSLLMYIESCTSGKLSFPVSTQQVPADWKDSEKWAQTLEEAGCMIIFSTLGGCPEHLLVKRDKSRDPNIS